MGRGQKGSDARDKVGLGTVRRPVIGLALGGGAARGFAHIGIINTLASHGLERFFTTLQTSDQAPSKPHPAMLHQAMRDVGAPAGAEVVTYCHSGARSEMAAQLLVAAGYDARNYVGSWHEWAASADLPIE